MKKILLLPFLFFSLACGFSWPIRPSTPPVVPPSPESVVIPTATMPLPPPPTPSYSLYENTKYGFSFSHPDNWPLNVQSDDYIEVGDQVVIVTWPADPLSLPGDRPIYETVTDVQPGAYPCKLVTGYMGSIGGYVPQQLRMYIFEHNGTYITITLYAVGLKATDGDMTQIVPLLSEDVKIFDAMVAGLRFE